MTLDLDKLEQAAKAAEAECPGEWIYDDDDGRVEYRDARYGLVRVVSTDDNAGGCGAMSDDVGRFIATCSPDVILALVARVRELKENGPRLDVYRDALREAGAYVCEKCMRAGLIGSHGFNTDSGRPRYYCRGCNR